MLHWMWVGLQADPHLSRFGSVSLKADL